MRPWRLLVSILQLVLGYMGKGIWCLEYIQIVAVGWTSWLKALTRRQSGIVSNTDIQETEESWLVGIEEKCVLTAYSKMCVYGQDNSESIRWAVKPQQWWLFLMSTFLWLFKLWDCVLFSLADPTQLAPKTRKLFSKYSADESVLENCLTKGNLQNIGDKDFSLKQAASPLISPNTIKDDHTKMYTPGF